MKTKKAQAFLFFNPIFWVVIGVILIGILILGIIFAMRIDEGLSAVFNFLTVWWPWLALSVTAFVFRGQIRAVINFVLGRLGVAI